MPKLSSMSYTQEKIFLGICSLAGSGISFLGALLSTGDVRWFCVTLSMSFITSCLLSLMFKQPEETIQLVVARCGLTILGGVFLTKYVAWQFNIQTIHTDIVAFGGLACLVSIITFVVGYKALRYLERRSEYLARKFVDSKVGMIINSSDKQ